MIPELTRIFRDPGRSAFQRNLSATVLCSFLEDDDPLLADLGTDATPTQLSRLRAKLQPPGPTVLGRLREIVLADFPPDTDETARDLGAKRRAHAAALLLEMDQPEQALRILQFQADPRSEAYLIDRLAECRIDPELLLRKLQESQDPSARAGLILALGSYSADSIPADLRTSFRQILLRLWRDDPNCFVHSAAEWALRSTKMIDNIADLRSEAAKVGPRDGYSWYVTPEGYTFAVIKGPVEARLGSPPTDAHRDSDETPVTRRIGQTFAIATTEVTRSQYLRLRPTYRHTNEHAPEPDCPINAVSWFDAACYCRLLSEKEGIPEDQRCFPSIDKIRPGMVLYDDVLSRTGYRLPTEAEWEYACRAGGSSIRYYGYDPALLRNYEWYLGNSEGHSWPVGSLKPNAFGLYDMLGNVSEWCLDVYARDLPAKSDDAISRRAIDRLVYLAQRGGGFSSGVRTIRSANRRYSLSQATSFSVGFRIVRTLPLDRLSR
jgi:formylglycine-generating enzyme required for sulfatase activity